MPLNEFRHNARWDAVMDAYYEKFSKAVGRPLIQTPEYAIFSEAVKQTTPLFNAAETEEEFDDAIQQMKEVLELKLKTLAISA